MSFVDGLVDHVAARYAGAARIVEAGVGSRLDVASALHERLVTSDVVVVDLDARWVRAARTRRLHAELDDVFDPSWPLYEGARLVYALRPPPEMVEALARIADRVGADLLIAPLSDEVGEYVPGAWTPVEVGGRIIAWLRAPVP